MKDAYFHVPVIPKHMRYRRFAYDGKANEFQVLPFGLFTAPKVFTRVIGVIEAFLKVQGMDMYQYLDDWLLKKQLRALIKRQRDLTLFKVNKLGFLVNKGKSQLVPMPHPAFLGSTLTSFVWWYQATWIYLNQGTEDELRWWAARANLTAGQPLPRSDDDNRNRRLHGGVGVSPGRLVVSGEWSTAWAKRHISWLDSQVVWLTMKHFVAWCCCRRLVRQCHNGSIHQQRGRDAVTLLVPTGVGMVQGTPGSQPLFREQERPGRRSVQVAAPPPHRTVHAQGDGGAYVRKLADPSCGSVYVQEEPQAASVLLSAPVSDVQRVKRFDAELGTPIWVHVPTIQPHTEDIDETGCSRQPGSHR